MLSKQATVLVMVAMVWTGLLGACSSEMDSPRQSALEDVAKHPISLTPIETNKPVSANEIGSFMVTLTHSGPTDTKVNVSLETTKGTSWKAALCFDDFCYMHNGKDKMRQTLAMAAGETRHLEIKMFVPKTATSGQAKILKLEAAAVKNLDAPAFLELEGFIP